jgi:hypothetical protein
MSDEIIINEDDEQRSFHEWIAICPYCKYENGISDMEAEDDKLYETYCEKCEEDFSFIIERTAVVSSYKIVKPSEKAESNSAEIRLAKCAYCKSINTIYVNFSGLRGGLTDKFPCESCGKEILY